MADKVIAPPRMISWQLLDVRWKKNVAITRVLVFNIQFIEMKSVSQCAPTAREAGEANEKTT